MILFILCVASVLVVITKLFPEKVNKVLYFFIMLGIGVWFAAQFVVKKSTEFYFDWNFASTAGGNIMQDEFAKTTMDIVIRNIHWILLFFIPVVFFLIFKKKMNFKKAKIA
ncbi:MAG: hypothetical protein J6X02_01730, partial [Bacilli bacterium]|nr:hypothetical protein [Bacilli bacterium]